MRQLAPFLEHRFLSATAGHLRRGACPLPGSPNRPVRTPPRGTRPRPARSDELLRRCASLAARARVDAITDLEATSLHELREVLPLPALEREDFTDVQVREDGEWALVTARRA